MRRRTSKGLAQDTHHGLQSRFGWGRFLLLPLLLLLPGAGGAADDDADIVLFCHLAIGEFGADAIDVCVKGNRTARAEVRRAETRAPAAAAHCTRQWEPDWVMAQRCVAAELAAAAALRDYAGNEATLRHCREQFGEAGEAEVKACVDRVPGTAPSASGAISPGRPR